MLLWFLFVVGAAASRSISISSVVASPKEAQLNWHVYPSTAPSESRNLLCACVAVQASFDRLRDRLQGLVASIYATSSQISLSIAVRVDHDARRRTAQRDELQRLLDRWAAFRSVDMCVMLVAPETLTSVYPINLMRNVAANSSCAWRARWILHLDADFVLGGRLDQDVFCTAQAPHPTAPTIWVLPALESRSKTQQTYDTVIRTTADQARVLLSNKNGSWSGFHTQRGFSKAQEATQLTTHWLEAACTSRSFYSTNWVPGYEPFGFIPAWMPPFDERFHDRYYNKVEYVERLALQHHARFHVLCDMYIFHLDHTKAPSATGHRAIMRRLLSSTRGERRHSVHWNDYLPISVSGARLYQYWVLFIQLDPLARSIDDFQHACAVTVAGRSPHLSFLGHQENSVEIKLTVNASQSWNMSFHCHVSTLYAILEPRRRLSWFRTTWHTAGDHLPDTELHHLQLLAGSTSLCLFVGASLLCCAFLVQRAAPRLFH